MFAFLRAQAGTGFPHGVEHQFGQILRLRHGVPVGGHDVRWPEHRDADLGLRLHGVHKPLRHPRQGLQTVERAWQVDKACHHQRKPQIGVATVFGAPVLADPECDLVQFAVHVAEPIVLQDGVICPGRRLARSAVDPHTVTGYHEPQERAGLLECWRCGHVNGPGQRSRGQRAHQCRRLVRSAG